MMHHASCTDALNNALIVALQRCTNGWKIKEFVIFLEQRISFYLKLMNLHLNGIKI